MELLKESVLGASPVYDKSKLIDSKGNPLIGNVVSSANMLPLLSNGYNRHNLEYETKLVPPLSLDKILDAPIASVLNLKIQPGENGFLFWFFVSSFLPLISACVAPLANMISIIGLVESWRYNIDTQELVTDPTTVKALNILSLCFGVIGNTSLLVNFTTPQRYVIAQAISIVSWSIASMLLLAAIIVLNKHYMDGPYQRTEGHWLSTFTVGYYFLNTCTMSMNSLGFIMGKYPALLNLNKSERNLMRYTLGLSFWLVIGAISSRYLIPDLDFGSALYYCVVSTLTIGLGDILPTDRGSKSFILVFSLVGVILMGLIVSLIRQVLHNTKEPIILWHQMEVDRKRVLHYLQQKNYILSQEEGFRLMRLIDHNLKAEREFITLTSTLVIFCLYWFIGALVFYFIEGWSYFDGIYFCLLCLITIGYGDFAPKKPLGRVFFISWAISAVPLMTILISNVGDTLFGTISGKDMFNQFVKQFKGLFIITTKHMKARILEQEVENHLVSVRSTSSVSYRSSQDSQEVWDSALIDDLIQDNTTTEAIDEEESLIEDKFSNKSLSTKIRSQKAELVNILEFVNLLKPLLEDSIDSPSMEYDHEAWENLINKLFVDEKSASKHKQKPNYWLSEESPLRLPLQEPNYFISRIFYRVETDLLKLIQEADKELEYLLKDKRN